MANPITKRRAFLVKLSDEEHRLLEQIAREREDSLSNTIRRLIREGAAAPAS